MNLKWFCTLGLQVLEKELMMTYGTISWMELEMPSPFFLLPLICPLYLTPPRTIAWLPGEVYDYSMMGHGMLCVILGKAGFGKSTIANYTIDICRWILLFLLHYYWCTPWFRGGGGCAHILLSRFSSLVPHHQLLPPDLYFQCFCMFCRSGLGLEHMLICGLERTSKDTVNYLLKEMSTTLLLARLNNADRKKFVEVLMDNISKDETYRNSILRPTVLQFFSIKLGSKYLPCLQAKVPHISILFPM